MLTIRAVQMRRLEDERSPEIFELLMMPHLASHNSGKFRGVPAAEIRAFLKDALAQAGNNGLTELTAASQYLEIAIIFGVDFGRTEAWAQRILHGGAQGQDALAAALLEGATAVLDEQERQAAALLLTTRTDEEFLT